MFRTLKKSILPQVHQIIQQLNSMKYLITESQLTKLHTPIQRAIDIALKNIKEESEDWSMDMMGEIKQVDSVDKIKVSGIEISKKLKVYIDIYISYPYYYFDDLISEIEARISPVFGPNIELIENEIKDERSWGPGINW